METLVTPGSDVSIQVLSDLDAISHKAAEIFLNLSTNSLPAKESFAVALSGGSTPRRFYRLLGSAPYRNQVGWRRIHFFWADERCVPREHEESNFKTVYDAFLSRVPVPEANIHRIRGEKSPDEAAREYDGAIKAFRGGTEIPVFDLIILGMGEDGHTASLFPGSEALREKKRLAVPVYKGGQEVHRVTLTLPILNNAFQVLFLVSGQSKSKVLSEILEGGEKRSGYPAGLVAPAHGKITWLIDREAAEKLREI
jgi:6-phosphogluconolactonase